MFTKKSLVVVFERMKIKKVYVVIFVLIILICSSSFVSAISYKFDPRAISSSSNDSVEKELS